METTKCPVGSSLRSTLQSQNNIVREFPRAVLKARWKVRKKGKAYSPEFSIKEDSFTKPK